MVSVSPAATPPPPPPPPSIHSLPFRTGGGIWSRNGLAFQDHVAVGYCLDMVGAGSPLKAVWCEWEDDITLIHENGVGEVVEFVQVKSDDPGHYWSASYLCKREGNRVGTSVLEKSLALDRQFREPRMFRMVTAVRVADELDHLTHPLGSATRLPSAPKVQALHADVHSRLKGFKSTCGNDCLYWLDNVFWEVQHSEDAVRNRNLRILGEWLDRNGIWLMSDQKDTLYVRLLVKVQEAAKASAPATPEAKKLARGSVASWLLDEARRIEHPERVPAGEWLKAKLESANIPAAEIAEAAELRRQYRQEQISGRYVGREDLRKVEWAVRAKLMALRAKLDAGRLADLGVQFHATCVEELEQLMSAPGMPGTAEMPYALGCMYNVSDRCVHRFRRETV